MIANHQSSTPAARLLAWYDLARRDLPWRQAPGQRSDPYAVWLSEIMLQQTTVATVKPYFARFLARWPDVAALAAAPLEAVLAEWAGLGYYSRARNLHACAVQVVTLSGGRFPETEAELRRLPGIGPYTAAAIAAIAFDRRAVVIDGNVERVVARHAAIAEPLPGARARIRQAADALTPDRRAGDFAQAMMDLGATLCTPSSPRCIMCPLVETCAGHRDGVAARLPVKAPRAARPTRLGHAFVAVDGDNRLLVRTRPPRGLLGGMLEVPGSDWQEGAAPLAVPPLRGMWREAGAITHIFTHFRLELTVHVAALPVRTPAPAGMRWLDRAELAGSAFPTVMRKVLERAGATA